MKYRFLGRTGLQVSVVGLGSWLTVKTHAQSLADDLHRTAYECGINFFDTANVYGGGETEAMVAEALKSFRRDTYVLATKVFFPHGEHPFPGVNDRGLSRKHIFEQCHRSLRELKTDYIDLYQCHRYDETTPVGETCAAMHTLIEQGKILYWGVSQWTADQIREAVAICEERNWHRPVSNQPQYNMFQRVPEQTGVFDTCEDLGLGNVVYSPLAQGVLSGKYRKGEPAPAGTRGSDEKSSEWMSKVLTDDVLDQVAKLEGVGEALSSSTAALALAWCLRLDAVTSCIIGASRPEQITENVAAAELHLDEVSLDRIRVILGD